MSQGVEGQWIMDGSNAGMAQSAVPAAATGFRVTNGANVAMDAADDASRVLHYLAPASCNCCWPWPDSIIWPASFFRIPKAKLRPMSLWVAR